MAQSSTTEIVSQAITAAVATLGFGVSIIQIRLLLKQLRSQHDWNRRSSTFSSSPALDRDLQDAKDRLRAALAPTGSFVAQVSLSKIKDCTQAGYPEIEDDIKYVLNVYEHLCAAMHNGVVDEPASYDLNHVAVIRYFMFFEPWIREARAQVAPLHIYRFLEKYAHKWTRAEVKDRSTTG